MYVLRNPLSPLCLRIVDADGLNQEKGNLAQQLNPRHLLSQQNFISNICSEDLRTQFEQ